LTAINFVIEEFSNCCNKDAEVNLAQFMVSVTYL